MPTDIDKSELEEKVNQIFWGRGTREEKITLTLALITQQSNQARIDELNELYEKRDLYLMFDKQTSVFVVDANIIKAKRIEIQAQAKETEEAS